ncbi:MAG: Ig-like domain-containing protein, partial [Patescibacteria group bacterium]
MLKIQSWRGIGLLFMVGLGVCLLGGNALAAPVSNVVLSDVDTTGFGLDGRDFTATWARSSTAPTGYINTQIFIVTSGINLVTTTLFSTGCNGAACMPLGFTNQFNQTTNTMMQSMQKDSASANLSTTTQYVAWVYTVAAEVSLVSSSPASTTFDFVADVSAPSIDHSPVHGAAPSLAAVINAFVNDDQTTQADFGTPTGNVYFKLFYSTSTWSPSLMVTSAPVAGSELFQFTVPTSSIPAPSSSFRYYLMTSDATGNVKLFCANPSAATSTDCQTSPFVVNIGETGLRTMSGTVSFNNFSGTTTPLVGVKVFAGGYSKAAVTTDADGNYTITGLPNYDAFDITATKVAYCKNSRFETIGSANKTGINLNLNPGSCFFAPPSGGGGGGGGLPMVMFSGPPDGMQGVPLNMGLRMGINQTMDASTINDADATNAGSNVYLTTDDGTTKIAGAVTFCANNTSPGCTSLFSMDTNAILFTPTGALSSSTFYTLVVTEGVKNTGGQSISGNRAGGGHKISFTTSGGTLDMGSFGTSGQFMPPYVKSMVPAPGITAAPNTGIVVEFNQAMSTASMTNTNIKLFNITNGANTEVTSGLTVALDSTESRFVTISHSALSAGTYEVRVLGAAANASGISMRPPGDAAAIAFRSAFPVAGSSDATAPTIYPMLANNATGVAVNNIFQFGFNEQLSFSTINTTNITLYRGATAASVSLQYDPGSNNVSVVPGSVLAPSTVYTLTLGSGVTDLAGIPLATSTYTYTTGAGDSVAPAFKEVRCDDYTCKVSFTEPMNHDAQVDSNFASSTLNHLRFALTQGGPDKIVTSTSLTYDALDNSVSAAGVGLTFGGANFSLVISGLTDMSGNILPNTTVGGPVEDSKLTFGSFGDGGMFAPPSSDLMGGGGIGGGVFTPMGFGSFTADQFSFGQADMAFPFNPSAGADSNVFQIKFNPGVVVANTDKIVLTFPAGTVATNAAADTFSPFTSDYNGGGAGTVTGVVTVDSATQVTIALTVAAGTPGTSDNYTIDLKKIVNPTIPKGPNTGGYTVGLKLTNAAGTTVKASKTSMPYFIMAGGTNTLTVSVVAGVNTSTPTSGANGNVFLHGGGPGGPMDKSLTLTNGEISAVDGTSATSTVFSNLNDGCYFLGTDPSATLGGVDYFGQMSPEPVCLSGGQAVAKYLLFTPSSAGDGSATVTIKFAGIADFGGRDIDIFAGGPGKFVVKTLSAVGVPSGSGYTVKLPANGNWFMGVGPSMPKGASSAMPSALPGVPPASIGLVVSGLPTTPAVGVGFNVPPGVSFNDSTDTVTFTFATADKVVTGTVKDGSGNGLANMNVFLHRQGFGTPVAGTTNASGTFSLSVSDFGNYQIGVTKDGLPPVFKQIEVRNESGTKIYMDGKLQTSVDLVVKKASYTISGKVLDSSSNGIASAPVFAVDGNGNSVFGQSSSDGSYSLYVDNGVWKVQSQMPPGKSDTCGSFSTTVTVSGSSQSSQNISPSVASCNTLTGTVSVGGAGLANAPLFIEEWNAGSNSPVNGGMKKQATTDSSGAYSVKLAPGTYRLG